MSKKFFSEESFRKYENRDKKNYKAWVKLCVWLENYGFNKTCSGAVLGGIFTEN